MAENVFGSNVSPVAVAVNGAVNADITNNSAIYGGCPKAVFTVTGGSTGTSIENNLAVAGCTMSTSLLRVDADSAATTHSDYNLVFDKGDNGVYSWAGTSYATAAQLTAAAGQGSHDLNVSPGIGAGYLPQAGSPVIDSADANAPGLLATDYYDNPREDDPSIANTGTGTGYVDRGAVELQDPLKLAATTNTWAAPVGGTVVVTLTGTPGWAPISGYTVDFGDGTPSVTTMSTTVSHVYTTARNTPYPITATVTDSLGYATENQGNGITVVPPAPLVPAMIVIHDDGPSSLTYTVDTSGTTDSWPLRGTMCDFGDGSGVSSNCRHTYRVLGTYWVTATVTDDGGNSASVSQLVVAGPPVPVVGPKPGGNRCRTCY